MQPLWFIPIAALLVIASKLPAAIAMIREGSGYDNHHPRAQQGRLTGWGQRAVAAHQNTLESFPIFAACLLAGQLLGVSSEHLLTCCVTFLFCRLLYVYFYITDRHVLRTTVWTIAYTSCLAMTVG